MTSPPHEQQLRSLLQQDDVGALEAWLAVPNDALVRLEDGDALLHVVAAAGAMSCLRLLLARVVRTL